MVNVSSGILPVERVEVIAERDALVYLAQLRLFEDASQFWLAGQDYLDQLTDVRFEIDVPVRAVRRKGSVPHL